MTPLTAFLNSFEKLKQAKHPSSVEIDTCKALNLISGEEGNEEVIREECHWHCDRITDSGPILRLETKSKNLTKAERYGHPYERPIYSSFINPEEMKTIVISFFSYAYRGVNVQRDYEWVDLHTFNKGIQWDLWTPLREDGLSLS